ncbi:hypothetical protein K5F93_15850 [Pseudomonas protegens]|uniref:hypothetical protein n=1 Tax=Pseudomonas protegens TaxID=380021 RepID=UPI001C8D7425|nr:hypothetical protein [Pseudomonas protegens]QZI67921.1 hypothetical protein K5F93_15850 [Pseudomonas protegens]
MTNTRPSIKQKPHIALSFHCRSRQRLHPEDFLAAIAAKILYKTKFYVQLLLVDFDSASRESGSLPRQSVGKTQ